MTRSELIRCGFDADFMVEENGPPRPIRYGSHDAHLSSRVTPTMEAVPGQAPATPAGRGRVQQACRAEAERRASLTAKASEADSFQARVDAVAVMTDISGDRPLLSHMATATVLQRNRLVIQVAGTRD